MKMLQSDGFRTEIEFRGTSLLLTNEDKGVWRLRSKTDTGYDDLGAAQTLARDLGEKYEKAPLPVKTEESDKELKITADDGSYVCVSKDSITVFGCNGKPVKSVTRAGKEGQSSFVSITAFRDERFYGTGERFDRVNQRGKKLTLYAVDRWCQTKGNSYIPIPVLLSSHSDMLLMNRYECSVFDICSSKKNSIIIEQKYAPVDLYFFTDKSAAANISAYCRLTGFAPMPPEWSFGTLVCRYHPEFYTKEGVFAMIDAMEQNPQRPMDAAVEFLREVRAALDS